MSFRYLNLGLAAALSLLAEIALSAEPAANEAAEAAAPAASPASGKDSTEKDGIAAYAGDENRYDGDNLKLRVNVKQFRPVDAPEGTVTKQCAPKGSKVRVTRQVGDDLYVRIKLPSPPKPRDPKKTESEPQSFLASEEVPSSNAWDDCTAMVNDYSQYRISLATLSQYAFRRTGVQFGALVVPFKFHLGGDKTLSASSTVAPYVGFRLPGPVGTTFTPVISSGLGLVPINDPDTDKTETKTAFSAALGVVLTHTKAEKFNAGVLLGKDFLNKTDRKIDPTADKIWFSLYAGYKL